MTSSDEIEAKSRDQFVAQVAKNIERSLSDNVDEAYIFGLSGKWGEGKTTFLEALETQLSRHVRVVRVNPWKYADDKISFLRVFLKKINDVSPYSEFFDVRHANLNKARHVARWLMKPVRHYKLRPLYDDVSKKRINYPILLLSLGLIIGLAITYTTFLDSHIKSFIVANKWFITALLVPVVLAVGQALMTSQKSYHALTTLDSFDNLIQKITRKFTHLLYVIPRTQPTKIVIFVDDLDRVTGSKAIGVLDNLRTFFDNQSFAFVVAGDHTVIERHLGKELLPDSSLAEQNEEGRRFLKKIFNVYWRLPLPIKPEVDRFIDKKILTYRSDKNSRLTAIGLALKNQDNREIFKAQLSYYFENNYRNMLRFVERAIFTFEVIETQLENSEIDDDKKAYFKEMKRKPLLVVRALLIEEIANPIYEKILADTSIFTEMETMAAIKSLRLDGLVSAYDSVTSSKQRSDFMHLLNETPRFYGETGVQVLNLKPYFYLASDSSFGDERGLSPSVFFERLRTSDANDIKSIIEQSGLKQMEAALKNVTKEMSQPDSGNLSAAVLTKLYSSILLVNSKFEVHRELSRQIEPTTIANVVKAVDDVAIRRDLLVAYTAWLTYMNTSLVSPFKFAESLSSEDISGFSNEDLLNVDLQQLTVCWFVNTVNATEPSAFEIFSRVANTIDLDLFSGYLAAAKERLIDAYMSQETEGNRDLALRLLDYLGPNARQEISGKILPLLRSDDLWMWSRAAEHVKNQLFSYEELDEILVRKFDDTIDFRALRDRMILVADKLHDQDFLWSYLVREKRQLLMDSFVIFWRQRNYPSKLYPSERYASALFKETIDYLNGQPDEYTILQYVSRRHGYFMQLNELPNRAEIEERINGEDTSRSVKLQLNRILNAEWPSSKS